MILSLVDLSLVDDLGGLDSTYFFFYEHGGELCLATNVRDRSCM